MPDTQTEGDFDRMSWHDCHIWRVEFSVGDPAEGDYTADLVIGLDFIVDWPCGAGRKAVFRVAPAMLVFHGVTDAKISIHWGDSGFQTAIHDLSIDGISRERVLDQKGYLDRPYYRWRIALNWPQGGEISCGAVGFSQTLLAEPVISEKQRLSRSERSRLTEACRWPGQRDA